MEGRSLVIYDYDLQVNKYHAISSLLYLLKIIKKNLYMIHIKSGCIMALVVNGHSENLLLVLEGSYKILNTVSIQYWIMKGMSLKNSESFSELLEYCLSKIAW